jgi:hypothetical protein
MLTSLTSGRGLAFDPGRQATCETIAMHVPHAPKQNRLLACLSAEDYQRLLPDPELKPIRPLPARVRPLAVAIQDGMR